MKKLLISILIPLGCALLAASSQAQVLVMQPLATFGTHGDGSVRPNDVPALTATNQLQRGVAYNPLTGHLLVVDRSSQYSGSSCDVHVLDGNTGAYLTKLDNSSTVAGGSSAFTLNLIGIADDGAIYVANLTTSTTGTPQTRLYRWSDESSPETIVSPTADFQLDDPSSGNTNSTEKRWGDTMAARGAGLSTQILLANRGTLLALYTPDDASYAHFTPKTLKADTAAGDLGFGLTFGSGNTLWGTSGANGNGPLIHLAFNATAGTATTLTNFPSPNFPGVISPILVMPGSNLLAGISMVSGADVVRLYDISNPNAPLLLDRKPFVTANDNNIFGGALTLGTNGILYALDSDNGIMAFTLINAASNPLAPVFFLNPANKLVGAGSTATLTSGADSSASFTYQWIFNGTNALPGATSANLNIVNAQTTNSGQYAVIASNSIGSSTSSVAVLTVAATPPTTLLVYEPFNYTSGQLLTLASANWTTNGNGNDSFVAPFGLSVPGLASPIGNSVTNGGSGAGLRLILGSTNTSGDLFYSFAMRVDAVGSLTTGFIAAFVDPSGASAYVARLNVRAGTAAHTYNLGISKVNTTVSWATNDFPEGQTLFIVGRYTFNTGSTTDDQADLWINPDASTFAAASAPSPTASAAQSGTDNSLISQFTFRQNTTGNTPAAITYDELRIGLTWSDVTPIDVASPRLTILSNGNGTVTISWPTSATGYNLESEASLASPSTWAPVTNSITPIGTNQTVTVNAGTGNQFFRLKK
jgi:Ig-like domain-containing protein